MKESEIIHYIKTLGINDDDAAWTKNEEYHCFTTDALVFSTDVPEKMNPYTAGRKSVVMNLSDLAAMGSTPLLFLCSLNLPKTFSAAKELINGIHDACREYTVSYAGGDINEGELSVTGFAVGKSKGILRRNAAKVGDLVCITGDIGRVYCYFKGAEEDIFKEKVFNPAPRIKEGQILNKSANACIDISDGASKELNLISKLSNVKIELENLPIHPSVVEFAQEKAVEYALNSGEEFELIFTMPKNHRDIIEEVNATVVGRVTAGEGVFYREKKIEKGGWEHLATNSW
ncbi:MAG: thiamine-phosphate kinase [Euryarchaeota archaeon]|nr:thiamine-phosphate kinase [Euryarchaeota archaeon]